jgi:hypothetical protein
MMPTRHGAAEPEGVADGHHPVADAHLLGFSERHLGQRLDRLDLEHRQISLGIGADQFGLEFRAVGEVDLDVVGAFDDMIVGDDDAFLGIDDKARTERRNLAVAWPLPLPVAKELIKEILER